MAWSLNLIVAVLTFSWWLFLSWLYLISHTLLKSNTQTVKRSEDVLKLLKKYPVGGCRLKKYSIAYLCSWCPSTKYWFCVFILSVYLCFWLRLHFFNSAFLRVILFFAINMRSWHLPVESQQSMKWFLLVYMHPP